MPHFTYVFASLLFPNKRAPLATALILTSSSIGLAGLIGPGGGSHTWTGAITDGWHNAANWTGGVVPGNTDAAIIDGGPFNNIFLNADSGALASLFISGAKTVSTNGFQLNVTNSAGSATASGLDATLFVANAGGSTAFESNVLTIENQGRLQVSGGSVRILQQLTMTSAARLSGNGLVEVNSANPASFNGLGGASISATGGDLTLRVVGGGGFTLPPLVNVLDDNATLSIEGPLFIDDFTDVNLGVDTAMHVDENWNLTGTLNANPGIGIATVTGGSIGVDGAIEADSGGLIIDTSVTLRTGSTLDIAPNATVVLNSSQFVGNGQNTTVSFNGTLRIDGTQVISSWNGDINLSAGSLEVNEPQVGSWSMNGDLTLGSLAGFRSHLRGDAPMTLSGNLLAPDLGGFVDNELLLRSSSLTQLVMPFSELTITNSLRLESGAEVSGTGFISITETGAMSMQELVDVNVDIVNAGFLEVLGDDSEVGYANIQAAFTQAPTGALDVQIAGPTPFERDVYETSLTATLAGSLTVSLIDSYTPTVGDTFLILTGNGGVIGSFDSLDGDPGFEIIYIGNSVTLIYVGLDTCPTDLNGDGVTDTADLGLLLAVFGTANPAVDLNNDGVIDTADLGILLSQFGVLCL